MSPAKVVASKMDFQVTARAALANAPALLAKWLPGGKLQGQEYLSTNPTRADHTPGSFKVNTATGKWGEFATGEAGGDLISLRAYLDGINQVEALKRVADELGTSPVPKAPKPRIELSPVLPIPDSAPKAQPHPRLGKPDQSWCYRNEKGDRFFYVCRFQLEGGGKAILPLTYWSNGWQWKALPAPRPLYCLDRLTVRPNAPVLVVEGEKAADAAQNIFPDLVVVTSPGGSKAVSKASWGPLKGREVTIWPDHDQPGSDYAQEVARLANEAGASTVRIVEIPQGFPPAWDLADSPPEGWGREKLKTLLDQAVPSAKASTPIASSEHEGSETIPWPTLDQKALPLLVGDFVELATRESEADPAAVLATLLARFGAEVGPEPHLMVGDTRHPARLMVAIVGASSKSRKGTSAEPVKRLFSLNSLDSHIPAHTSPGPLSTGEGLVFRVRDEVKKWQVDKGGEGKWVVVDPGEEDKRLFILDEELAAALNCSKRDGNTLSTCIRSLWDSGNADFLVKHNPTKTTGAHICITTHITEYELSKKLGETDAFNGFANRFLWICARRQQLVPFPLPMPDREFEALKAEVFRRIALARTSQRMHLDDEAKHLWGQVYPELSKDNSGLAGCIINRAEAQTLRLALTYALLDGADEVTATHLESALAFWRYAEESALYVFGGMEADPLTRKIVAALATGPLTATDLHKALGNRVSKDQLRSRLKELEARGRVKHLKEQTDGPPKHTYWLCERSEISELSSPTSSKPNLISLNSPNSQAPDDKWEGPGEVEV